MKSFFIASIILITFSLPAFSQYDVVISSGYNPFSYQDLIAPVAAAQAAREAQKAKEAISQQQPVTKTESTSKLLRNYLSGVEPFWEFHFDYSGTPSAIFLTSSKSFIALNLGGEMLLCKVKSVSDDSNSTYRIDVYQVDITHKGGSASGVIRFIYDKGKPLNGPYIVHFRVNGEDSTHVFMIK